MLTSSSCASVTAPLLLTADKIPTNILSTAQEPAIGLVIFHLQDVCVRVQKGMRKRLRTAALEKAPQIEATFRWLRKRNIQIHLLSDYSTEETNILMDRLGWKVGAGALIDCVVVDMESVGNPIQTAIDLAGIDDPARTVVVVDTPELLDSAAGAKVRFNIGVTSGSCSYQALQHNSYRALLDNTVQLVNYLLDHLPSLAEARGTGMFPPLRPH